MAEHDEGPAEAAGALIKAAIEGGPLRPHAASLAGTTLVALWRAYGARMLNASWRRLIDFARQLREPDPPLLDGGAEQPAPEPTAIDPDALAIQLRALLDAPDPAVIPALARLVKLYAREGRRPDAFFRGMTRALCEFGPADFAALQELAHACAYAGIKGPLCAITISTGPLTVVDYGPSGTSDTRHDLGHVSSGDTLGRVVRRLLAHDVMRPYVAGPWPSQSAFDATVYTEVLAQIWAVVRPATSDAAAAGKKKGR